MVPVLEVAYPNLEAEINLTDKRLFSSWEKVQSGERLSSSAGVTLLETDD